MIGVVARLLGRERPRRLIPLADDGLEAAPDVLLNRGDLRGDVVRLLKADVRFALHLVNLLSRRERLADVERRVDAVRAARAARVVVRLDATLRESRVIERRAGHRHRLFRRRAALRLLELEIAAGIRAVLGLRVISAVSPGIEHLGGQRLGALIRDDRLLALAVLHRLVEDVDAVDPSVGARVLEIIRPLRRRPKRQRVVDERLDARQNFAKLCERAEARRANHVHLVLAYTTTVFVEQTVEPVRISAVYGQFARAALLRVKVRGDGVVHPRVGIAGGDALDAAEENEAQLGGGHVRDRLLAGIDDVGDDARALARGPEVQWVHASPVAGVVHPPALVVAHPALVVAIVELGLEAVVRRERRLDGVGFGVIPQDDRDVLARRGHRSGRAREGAVGVEDDVRIGDAIVRVEQAAHVDAVDGDELALDVVVDDADHHLADPVRVLRGLRVAERRQLADGSDLVVARDGVVVQMRKVRRRDVLVEGRHGDDLHVRILGALIVGSLATVDIGFHQGLHHADSLGVVRLVELLDGHELEVDHFDGVDAVAGVEIFLGEVDALALELHRESRGTAKAVLHEVPVLGRLKHVVVGLVIGAADFEPRQVISPFRGVLDRALLPSPVHLEYAMGSAQNASSETHSGMSGFPAGAICSSCIQPMSMGPPGQLNPLNTRNRSGSRAPAGHPRGLT